MPYLFLYLFIYLFFGGGYQTTFYLRQGGHDTHKLYCGHAHGWRHCDIHTELLSLTLYIHQQWEIHVTWLDASRRFEENFGKFHYNNVINVFFSLNVRYFEK